MIVPSRSRKTAAGHLGDAIDGGEDARRLNAGHATVIDRAFTKHTGSAPDGIGHDFARHTRMRERCGRLLIGRSEDRDDGDAGSGGQMHRAGIVGDARGRDAHDAGERGQPRLTSEIEDLRLTIHRHGVANRASRLRIRSAADERARDAPLANEIRDEPSHVRRDPLLRLAVGGAWREHDQQTALLPSMLRQQPFRIIERVRPY